MNNTTEIYRGFLQDELSGPARMNEKQVATVLKKFDKLTQAASPDTSFLVIHEAFGSTDTNKALNFVRSAINQALEAANKDGKKIETNPRVRLSQII